MRNMKQVKWMVAVLMIAVLPWGVTLAQETAASINGTIVDSDGNVLSGATVIVTHEPTGQVKTLTTNDSGRYSARGLRVGGPYKIEVRNGGYADAEEGNVFIKLGEDRTIDAVLVADAISLDTVKAVGVANVSATFNPDNMGTGTSVSQEQITNLPTVDRDIQDYVRLDSRVNLRSFGNGISVSGVNNRFNNISIDGVGIGDPFGLEANGSPGLSQPFSLDTIQELNVQLSPYDVTLSNFTGANINAITKSGTNEFTGRAAFYYSDDDLQRDDADFTREVYSVSAGGPIIKDKLFFFLAYEKEEQTRLNNTSGVDTALAQQVADIASSVYGVNIGGLNAPSDLVTEEESIVVKLDWNINDYHRASFKYQNNEDSQPIFPNFGSRDISFSSHWYTNAFENKSYNLNLYSDWTANFSTELRISNSEFDKIPDLNAVLPSVEVQVGDGQSVWFGTEEFRHANELNVVTDNIYLEGNYFMGDHNLTFGVDWREQDIRNLFISQALGLYEFDSIDDFANGIHSRYEYNRGTNEPRPEANWSWENLGLFIQDNWTVNDRLTLQYGLRFDKPDAGNKPRLNQDFLDAYGFVNNSTVSEGTIQPRIGFNYDMSDERMMQLRGGIGVFTGGTPNVWLSNSFTNTGGDLTFYSSNGIEDGMLFTLDPNNQPILDGSSRQNVDVLDPDFVIPTVLKSNLAVDAELPWFGLVGSVELEYIKAQDAIDYQHLNLGAPTGTLPDGRLTYWEDNVNLSGSRANANPDFNDVIYLTNTSKGDTKRATVSLELPQTEHWYAKASYTYTDATEASAGTSSRAISNWNNTPAFNPNQALAATSAYEVENAFVFMTTYQNMFFGDNYTNIGLVWISQDGEPFSYTYSNDVNGDGIRDNDLVYVPMPNEYVLADPSEAADFEAFLRSSGLAQYRGRVAPRNGFKAPRINTVDLNMSQELPAWGPVRATLFFNVKNLGNLLDSDWGQVQTAGFDGEDVYRLNSLENGVYELDWNGPTRFSTNRTASQWRAQIGFRLDW
jgi:outer membrane receptor for ferrienterochelin and colicin